jgi:hypothetical protein
MAGLVRAGMSTSSSESSYPSTARRIAAGAVGVCAVLLALVAVIAQVWLLLVVAAVMGVFAGAYWRYVPPPSPPAPPAHEAPAPQQPMATSPALEREVEQWVKKGFHVTNRTSASASLYKPKRVGKWTGAVGYAFRKDQTVYLRLDEDGRVKMTRS